MPAIKKLDDSTLHSVQDYCINVKSRDIYIHSHVTEGCEESGIDYIVASRFIKNIHYLNNVSDQPITVHLHCDGGSWIDGMAIYDSIILSKSPVTVIAYASVSSMSTVILQAAQKRVLMPSSEFMIHYGSMGVEGNSISVKSAVDQNELANEKMLEIYVDKCSSGKKFKGFTPSRRKKFIDRKMRDKQEWYMTANEAISYGFADKIYGEK